MAKKISKDEFMEKYGDVMVTFDHYYKYTFTYAGKNKDGVLVEVSWGGNADDIYRCSVSAGNEESVESLYPYDGTAYKDGEAIEEFYEEGWF